MSTTSTTLVSPQTLAVNGGSPVRASLLPYIPVYRHPYYRDRFGTGEGDSSVAEEAYARMMSLPMFHGMSNRDAEDVIEAIKKVVGSDSK